MRQLWSTHSAAQRRKGKVARSTGRDHARRIAAPQRSLRALARPGRRRLDRGLGGPRRARLVRRRHAGPARHDRDQVGAAVEDTGQALGVVGGLPLVGGQIGSFAATIETLAAEVVVSGQDRRESIRRVCRHRRPRRGHPAGRAGAVAVSAGAARAGAPRGRIAEALPGVAADPAFEQYLARRAIDALPWDSLRAMSRTRGARSGGRLRALADAELERLGLPGPDLRPVRGRDRVPAVPRSTSRTRPPRSLLSDAQSLTRAVEDHAHERSRQEEELPRPAPSRCACCSARRGRRSWPPERPPCGRPRGGQGLLHHRASASTRRSCPTATCVSPRRVPWPSRAPSTSSTGTCRPRLRRHRGARRRGPAIVRPATTVPYNPQRPPPSARRASPRPTPSRTAAAASACSPTSSSATRRALQRALRGQGRRQALQDTAELYWQFIGDRDGGRRAT